MARTSPSDHVRGDHRAASSLAGIGAVFFILSTLCFIDGISIERTARDSAPGGHAAYEALNVTNLQVLWRGRRESQPLMYLGELFGCAGWFSVMAPVGALTALLGGSTRSANGIVSGCFNAAAILSIMNLIFTAGTNGLVDYVSTWPLMTDAALHSRDGGFGALQGLELAFIVAQGRTAWFFAMDELLLSVGFATVAFLVYTSQRRVQKPLHSTFAHLSLVGAFSALIGFFIRVARPNYSHSSLDAATALSGLLVYTIMLPSWLVYVAVQLRQRSEDVAFTPMEGGREGGGQGTEMAPPSVPEGEAVEAEEQPSRA